MALENKKSNLLRPINFVLRISLSSLASLSRTCCVHENRPSLCTFHVFDLGRHGGHAWTFNAAVRYFIKANAFAIIITTFSPGKGGGREYVCLVPDDMKTLSYYYYAEVSARHDKKIPFSFHVSSFRHLFVLYNWFFLFFIYFIGGAQSIGKWIA